MFTPPARRPRAASFVLPTLALFAWCLAGPARAAVVVTLGGPDAEFRSSGATFVPGGISGGWVGLEFSGGPEDRYAVQFDLSSIPAGATISSAQLRLRDSQGGTGRTDLLSGFAGNGTFSAASVTGGTTLLTINSPNSSPNFYDVTAFVQGLTAGQFAGFSLRQSSLGAPANSYDSDANLFAPQLVITFAPAGGGGGSGVPLPPAVWPGLITAAALACFAVRRRLA